MVAQKTIALGPFERGIHVVTKEITQALPELPTSGLLNLFCKHTSSGLALNEAADPDVRKDLELLLDLAAPENHPEYRHTLEGPDDMPAHFKSLIFGASLTIPITEDGLALGRWQGILFGEFRSRATKRQILLTIYG